MNAVHGNHSEKPPPAFFSASSVLDIRKCLVTMAERAERAVAEAASAFFRDDASAANAVIEHDRVIDSLEIANDTAIYQYIALNHPEAQEMRFLIAAQQVSTMLERVGDHAVNVAEAALAISSNAEALRVEELAAAADRSRSMLRDAVESFFGSMVETAESVLRSDDEVDELVRAVSARVKELVFGGSMTFEDALEVIRVSKNLERVADLATNIAEETVFSVQARSVKHGGYACPAIGGNGGTEYARGMERST